MEAYCVKCKTKREMLEPEPIFTRTGTPATRGICPVCGTKLTRMGGTPAHQGMEPPSPEARRKRQVGETGDRRITSKSPYSWSFPGQGIYGESIGGTRARLTALAALGGCRARLCAQVPGAE